MALDSQSSRGEVLSSLNRLYYKVRQIENTLSSGTGGTSGLTKAEADTFYRPIDYVPAFSAITGKPTTITGYGITDAFTQTLADARYRPIAYVPTFAEVTSKPTTVSGYGITDAATLTGTQTLTNKTLSGASNTFSAIPNTAITGLGTMSTQNATAVAITGGTLATFGNIAQSSGFTFGTGATPVLRPSSNSLFHITDNGSIPIISFPTSRRILINGATDNTVDQVQVAGSGYFSTAISAGTNITAGGILKQSSAAGTVGIQVDRPSIGSTFFPFSDNRNYIRGTTIIGDAVGDRILLGTTTDDGVNKLQVTGTSNFNGTVTANGGLLKVTNGISGATNTPSILSLGPNYGTDESPAYFKFLLYDSGTPSSNYAFGISPGQITYYVPTGSKHAFRVNTTNMFTVDGSAVTAFADLKFPTASLNGYSWVRSTGGNVDYFAAGGVHNFTTSAGAGSYGAITVNGSAFGSSSPVTSSELSVVSTTKGSIPAPKMTAAQRAAIATPTQGLLVYQTDGAAGIWEYTGSAWKTHTAVTGNSVQSGNGSTTAFTIAHGLGYTPTYINVNAGSNDADGTLIKYVTADGTNITITYKTAPITGTNNLTFYYTAK